MMKVCPACRGTCMGGLHCKRCGAVLTDIGDRSKRDDVAGVGISIRALYAARAAMVLSCAGFLFGAALGLAIFRQSFGAGTAAARIGWDFLAAASFAIVWWGSTRLGKLHFDRTLAGNRASTGLSGAEHDFFPDGDSTT